MTEQEFYTKLQEDILDIDEPIKAETVLADIEEWDSLALVSFVALAKMQGASVGAPEVRAAVQAGDLYQLLQK